MNDIPEKLYTFDDNLVNASFFDLNKMLIKINHGEETKDGSQDNKAKEHISLTYEHELDHLFFMLGTSQGVYSLLMRFAFFTFVSQILKTKHSSQLISLPFVTEIKEDDDLSIILNSYRESYFYNHCPFETAKEYSLVNIRNIRLAENNSFKSSGSVLFPSIFSSDKLEIPLFRMATSSGQSDLIAMPNLSG